MTEQSHPPRVLEWILTRFLPVVEAYEKLGDFEEAFREVRAARGRLSAALFYLVQIVKAAPSFVSDACWGSVIMFKSYLTAAIRSLTRSRVYSILNIMGLAVGIAAFTLIGLYVLHELSYDRYHDGAERIYKVISEDQAVTPFPLAPALAAEFSEIESATHLISPGQHMIRCGNKEFFSDDWAWADEHFFSIFSYRFLSGDPETALWDPGSVVLTREMALKYFGSGNPVGKTLNWNGWGTSYDFKVTGVIEEVPPNSHVRADCFASLKTHEDFPNYDKNQYKWENYWISTFFKLREGHDPRQLEAKYPAFLTAQTGNEQNWRYRNIPLVDLHLRASDIIFHFKPVNDIRHISIFGAVGLIILLIAGLNYINLTTAISSRRMQEVGIRKVVGAQKPQLVRQFLGESLLLTMLALLTALILAYTMLPLFNRLIRGEQPIELFSHPGRFAALLGTGLAVGLLSAVYPAIFMAAFAPRHTLKSSALGKSRRGRLRGILVVFQFAISIFLIAGTLITSRQLHFIRNKKLGFNKDHVVLIDLRNKSLRESRVALKRELLNVPGIRHVSISTTIPMKIDWHNSFYFRNEEDPDDNQVMSHYARVDYDYVDLFELEIVQGRNFSREIDQERPAFIINQTIARQRGWDDPIGRAYGNRSWGIGTIIGVVRDFHNENMHIPIGEVTLVLKPDRGNLLSIKLETGDVPGAMAAIEEVYTRFSGGVPFEYEFMDERYDRMYHTEIRLGRAFNHFAVLAVFLCCLGLFGLASFSIDQGTKEIAVRKVLGASAPELVRLLSWKFLKWVIAANLIAWPMAYLAMNSWLKGFVYRIDIGWNIFVIAGTSAAAIAFLTILTRTARAALSNPADSLRHE